MKIEIFDVEHGQCSMIHCPNGKKLMIDAGTNTSTSWKPSRHFQGQKIEQLIITNFDRDHTSDFPALRSSGNLNSILRNPSITSSILAKMKEESGMSPGIKDVFNWLSWLESQPFGETPLNTDLGAVDIYPFWIDYPIFTDANNLSLATFITYEGFTILFPGDLEIPGWKELLKDEFFQKELKKVTILVASHHGRANGCCEEIFRYCTPQAVIISDAGIEHASQETTQWYANRVSGCLTRDNKPRSVFTTRNDKKITIDVVIGGNWFIATG